MPRPNYISVVFIGVVGFLFAGCGEHIPEVHVCPPARGIMPPVDDGFFGAGIGASLYGLDFSVNNSAGGIFSGQFSLAGFGSGERRLDSLDEYSYVVKPLDGFEGTGLVALGKPPSAPVMIGSFSHIYGFNFDFNQAALGFGGYVSQDWAFFVIAGGLGYISGSLDGMTFWLAINTGANIGPMKIVIYSGNSLITSADAGDFYTPQLFDCFDIGIKLIVGYPIKASEK